ncbi:MAG: hypothetical protein APR63_09495 [Desulfuromonas sp. SDB]|nr:MAG: hypothetical protein APR63_09495 [Desulfuromonas sp. SDB]
MKIGRVKAGGVPLVTLGVAGIAKPFLEGVIAKTPVGNSTVISGIAKIIGAMAVRQFVGGNTIGNGVQIALAVDGIEDCFIGFMGGGLLGGGGQDNW